MKKISDTVVIFMSAFLCMLCYVFIFITTTTKAEYYKAQFFSMILGFLSIVILLARIKQMSITGKVINLSLMLTASFGIALAGFAIYRY